MSKKLRKSWEQRSQERTKQEAIKALEKQMKGEKQAEKDVCGWKDCIYLLFYNKMLIMPFHNYSASEKLR